MFCPKCGTKNIDEARFCGACGTPLDANAGIPAPRAANAYAPAPQVARVQPSAAPGGKNALPLLIAAASFIAVVLIAVFVVVPAFNENFNENPFKGCQEGDVVEFGSYEQDDDISNGKEPIEWRVLTVNGTCALAVSQKALDAHVYNEDELDGDFWDFDALDTWLENDFASQAFTDDEMKVLQFPPMLLDEDQADQFFMSDKDRICMPTQQAVNNGAWTWGDNGACGWWLESQGAGLYGAAFVGADGVVDSDGRNVPSTNLAVRPALWVNL